MNVDFDTYLQYNLQDVLLVQKVHEKILAWYRAEYLPRFGSAWENMMRRDMHHTND